MKRKEYEEKIKAAGLLTDTWLSLKEIGGIYLTSGISLHYNPEHTRYLLKKDKLLVQYGTTEFYGDRLHGLTTVSGDYKSFSFKKNQIIKDFRLPRMGDTLTVINNGKIINKSLIMNTGMDIFGYVISTATSLYLETGMQLAFYDTAIYRENKRYCLHNILEAGVFKRYIPNLSKRQYGGEPYHEVIKIKKLSRIEV